MVSAEQSRFSPVDLKLGSSLARAINNKVVKVDGGSKSVNSHARGTGGLGNKSMVGQSNSPKKDISKASANADANQWPPPPSG